MAEPSPIDLLKRIEDLQKELGGLTGKKLSISDIPQGPSSRLDSDTVDGFQVSHANSPSPNSIVPVDNNGKMPVGTQTYAMMVAALWGEF